MQEISDEALFNLVKIGCSDAFDILIIRYRRLLFASACQRLGIEEAEDAVQELFIWIWQKKGSVQLQSSLKNYLCGAIKHYCLNKIRSQKMIRKRQQQYAYIRDICIIPSELETKELGMHLQRAIDNIAPASRAVFQMQYLEGISQREIAAQRGIGLQTVKNQVLAALKELRSSLKQV